MVTVTIRIGISGWTYPPWRGVFYPSGLPHRLELDYAAARMTSIEINGSFYALQRPASYRDWLERTPDDFVFSVKAPRFITHMKKLRDCAVPVANFFASGPLALGTKLGPVLWQLPPNLGYDRARIEQFLDALPRSTGEAAFLARRHDERLTGRAWTGAADDRLLRHALEVRHRSFCTEEFLALLADRSIAVVVADTAGKWPQFFRQTADFGYVRLHGAEELYASGYDAPDIERWARRVRKWSDSGRDVFVYFDNDIKVRAPRDAMALQRSLGVRASVG
jgi:uncharacterized protein YecE (DUF72 family)